jgi:hypothetical protein
MLDTAKDLSVFRRPLSVYNDSMFYIITCEMSPDRNSSGAYAV